MTKQKEELLLKILSATNEQSLFATIAETIELTEYYDKLPNSIWCGPIQRSDPSLLTREEYETAIIPSWANPPTIAKALILMWMTPNEYASMLVFNPTIGPILGSYFASPGYSLKESPKSSFSEEQLSWLPERFIDKHF